MQQITSAKTSLNQIPALHRWIVATQPLQNQTVIDYGGGKFNRATLFLMKEGARLALVHDRFNRSDIHNKLVADYWQAHEIDMVLCANVLNVIDDLRAVRDAVFDAVHVSSGATKYFTVYEGDRSGIGRETSRGYQRNETTSQHHARIAHWLGYSHEVTRQGSVIIARPL